MERRRKITFNTFTLDTIEKQLFKGTKKIHLRPKSFALLQHLIIRSGHLVNKDELLNAVWRDCNVGEEALKHCMVEIRRTLGDNAEKPRYIETVHRRGYRFIGKFAASHHKDRGKQPQYPENDSQDLQPGTIPFVGRDTDLAQLQRYLEETMKGSRQVVFISGEQGIGKTRLVDTFLDRARSRKPAGRRSGNNSDPFVSRGQCIQSHGTAESYMPLLEILTGLCHMPESKHILNVLCRYAPLWMSQMPSQLSMDQILRIRISLRNATRERMLRELAEALEELSLKRPMILVLEDLHWSDPSTLDWLQYWSQRRGSSKLLLIATYRTTELTAKDHMFNNIRRELNLKQLCRELPLAYLDEYAVGEYLKQRFQPNGFPAEMTLWVLQRTGGNPLFMANILNHLVEQGLVIKRNRHWILTATLENIELTVPPTIRQIIDQQLERCSPEEQKLLQAASVKGIEFSIAGAAAALNKQVDAIEEICRNLAAGNRFLQPVSDSADPTGEKSPRYRFIHELYRNICYQRIPSEQRSRLHRKVGEFLEQSGDRQPEELYAQLAMHFDRGREYRRAVQYYLMAVDNANAHYAGHEALDLATRGIQMLEKISASTERMQTEVCLQNALGTAVMSIEGLGAPKAGEAFSRARTLANRMNLPLRSRKKVLLFRSLYGLWSYHWARAEYATARRLADQLAQLAKTSKDAAQRAQSHYALGIILMDHGEYAAALDHLQNSTGVISRCCAEIARWHVGYPDRAMKTIKDILAYALETRNAENVIFAYLGTARLNVARGEYAQARENTQSAMDIALDQGMSEPWLTPMKIIHGWATAKLGDRNTGIQRMRQALSVFQDISASNLKPLILALFADILLDSSLIEEGLAVVEEALEASGSTGMHHYDSELYRLKGELLMQPPKGEDSVKGRKNSHNPEAKICFIRAKKTARRQQAKSLELRAATSLARLCLKQNRRAEAFQRLERVYNWFTEGHDTIDLQNASVLLEELKQ
jgi:predicted ATPase/DNA-binding winged helix-turn-helix (wHTH) protein